MTKTRDLADLGGGFIQAGTGAVQRTVELKLQDVVSVKDFGAVGDGVADDTAAIQAAIDYAASLAGGTTYYNTKPSVYFPSGKYEVTSGLVIDTKKFIHLCGDGAYLQITGTGAATILTITDSWDISISGLAFGANPTGGAVNSTASVGIQGYGPKRLDIIDCDFFNLNKSINVEGAFQMLVSTCRFNQNTRTTAAAASSIEHSGRSGESAPGGGIRINNCEFTGSATVPTTAHINLIGIDGCYITNSHLIYYQTGLRIAPTTALENQKIYQVIASNVYFDEGESYCVNFTGDLADAGLISGVQFSNCYFRTCIDNVRFGVTKSAGDTGVLKGIQFTGCRFGTSDKRAVLLATNTARVEGLLFDGCTFFNSNGDNAASNSPITVNSISNTISLCGNQFGPEANTVTDVWTIDPSVNSLLTSANNTFLSTGTVPYQNVSLTVTNASISTLTPRYSYDGNQVSLRFPSITATVTATGTINMATLPTHLSPESDLYLPMLLSINGATYGVGSMQITAAGQLKIYNIPSSGLYQNFTAGAVVVTQATCFTYNVI